LVKKARACKKARARALNKKKKKENGYKMLPPTATETTKPTRTYEAIKVVTVLRGSSSSP
jgi:hypothetical protein